MRQYVKNADKALKSSAKILTENMKKTRATKPGTNIMDKADQ